MNNFSKLIWGWPLIFAILALGTYLSCKLMVLKLSRLKLAFKYAMSDGEKGSGDISIFASLCTALSATLGTGNIVGMAVAVTTGGPGALFWLWISSIFSLSLKYAESFLAVKYRKFEVDGTVSGGPMYYMRLGFGSNALAKVFAVSGMAVALVGIGTLVQSNSIAVACGSFGLSPVTTTAILSIVVAIITIGGLRKIAAVAEKVVPIMTILYIGAAIVVLLANIHRLPGVFYSVFRCAFDPQAVLGGGIGISASVAASVGVSRGIFSHESGLGSSAIAAAAARVDSPAKQGLASMSGAILSVVVCTMTMLVVLVVCDSGMLFGESRTMEGAMLTSYAFGEGLGSAKLGNGIVGVSIVLFAFTTIIGWNYYGEKCTQYLFGKKAVILYKLTFILFVAIGPFFKIAGIFALADIVVGVMAISNLIGLGRLGKVVIDGASEFFANPDTKGN
ncbi:MAG: amino acid carrier protein [Puniceicoccales bacterium]|nr:amino acid carrier protein [Puniceicoccales bacterium]